MRKSISKISGWMMQQILFQLSTPRDDAVAHITLTLQHSRKLWHINVALFNYSMKLIGCILTLFPHSEITVSKCFIMSVVRLEEVSKRGCGLSILGNIQNPAGHGPSQPAQWGESSDLLRYLLPSPVPYSTHGRCRGAKTTEVRIKLWNPTP